MAKAGNKKGSVTKDIVLSGSLSLRTASEISGLLQKALDEADTVKLSLRDVEDVDLSLIQLLCAAHRSAIVKKKSLLLQGKLPDVFVRVVEDAGLSGHIGCSSAERECCVWQIN